MKVGQVVNGGDAFARLMQERVPAATAFRLAQVSRRVQDVLSDFEKARVGLVRKYGDEKADGSIEVRPDNMADFQSELAELLDTEVEPGIERISLASISSVALSTVDMLNLDWLFCE